MNEVIKAILNRRTVRAFTDEPLKREQLEIIAECGCWAPSSWNDQSTRFAVITDAGLIERLAKNAQKHLDGELSEYNFFGARQIIVLYDKRENINRLADAGCAAENMLLAAHSMGIGGVWINQFTPISYCPDTVRLLNETLGIAEDEIVCAVLAFGYPAEIPQPKPRKMRVKFFD